MITKSLPVPIKIKKLVEVAQLMYDTTNKKNPSKNIWCICKMKSETVYKCCKCNSGCYWSRDCQRKQFNEREKYCRYVWELESLEQGKLKHYSKDYSVTDNETLPTKLWNKLVKILERHPL